MEKPYKYWLFNRITQELEPYLGYYSPPVTHELFAYIDGVYCQKFDIYIDTRYEAKLRLFNYITYTRKGLPVPVYKPSPESLILP